MFLLEVAQCQKNSSIYSVTYAGNSFFIKTLALAKKKYYSIGEARGGYGGGGYGGGGYGGGGYGDGGSGYGGGSGHISMDPVSILGLLSLGT